MPCTSNYTRLLHVEVQSLKSAMYIFNLAQIWISVHEIFNLFPNEFFFKLAQMLARTSLEISMTIGNDFLRLSNEPFSKHYLRIALARIDNSYVNIWNRISAERNNKWYNTILETWVIQYWNVIPRMKTNIQISTGLNVLIAPFNALAHAQAWGRVLNEAMNMFVALFTWTCS
jgi:hypothetical protein